ncbi:MAG: lipoxygenase [Deltaproteobacteria bacterium]|nr:lipoxygenase [Deltaproteobacteria bacterium]
MFKPTLPQDDADSPARAEALGLARETHRYSYVYPPGAAWADEVPRGEGYSIPYVADYLKIEAALYANHFAAQLGGIEDYSAAQHDKDRASLQPERLGDHLFYIGQAIAASVERVRLDKVDDFARFFALIDRTRSLRLFQGTTQEQDELFAWQRLAGANPMVIEGLDALPERMPVTEEHFAAAMKIAGISGDSLERALGEGRLFVADYHRFEGAQNGKNGETAKWLYAPIALFVRPVSGPALLPVAIQCGQTPGDAYPIWTPADGPRWKMARTIVQIADGNDHETRQHLGKAHGVMEAVVLAGMRNLPPQHPLHVLLTPHFETTLQINDSAKNSLVAPGGGVDHVLGGTLETSVRLTALGLAELRIDEASPIKQLALRKVDDTSRLPVYPYRDDAIDVWGAISRFVSAYVELYYADDERVASDTELAAFLAELGSQDGGRLVGVPTVTTRAVLSELVASLIFIASAQHSALNYAQFEYMGMIPNMPGAGYAPAPTRDTPDAESSYVDLLPPLDIAIEHFTLAYELSNIRRNHLGEYPFLHWKDPAARALADAFAKHLADLELLLGARDGSRLLPYPFLRPSMIAASIHI